MSKYFTFVFEKFDALKKYLNKNNIKRSEFDELNSNVVKIANILETQSILISRHEKILGALLSPLSENVQVDFSLPEINSLTSNPHDSKPN